jgi:superoxide dismutase, Fe-Mn family
MAFSPDYAPKNFEHLLGTAGFSDQLLKNHFTLYEGYVKNTNAIQEKLKNGVVPAGTPEYAELKRRFGWEWNGMRLHELYFANMTKGGKAITKGGEMEKILTYIWTSIDGWKKDFVGTGTMRGIGWVVLALDTEKHMVFNTWIGEHDIGHLSGSVPLLIMDVFEHAFMIDYGLKRADYIEAFMNAIDWSVVEGRLAAAMKGIS